MVAIFCSNRNRLTISAGLAARRKINWALRYQFSLKYGRGPDLALRLGLPFWVYTINKPLGCLSFLFIRI